MSFIRKGGGYPFWHGGQLYNLVCLLGSDGWRLYVNVCPDGELARETGHSTPLPASASDDDLQNAAAELQRRIEAGDAPNEEPDHGH